MRALAPPSANRRSARSWISIPGIVVFAATLVAALALTPEKAEAQAGYDSLRVIVFGGHPDDCELDAGGTAAKWAERGAAVKFVSATNGDVGHFRQAGGPLARRRQAEVHTCAEIFGIETEVLDIHDGELMPTLENRKKFVRLIREWEADIVIAHRTNDYHPDHRYVGELVHDAAVMVMAKNFLPLTPALDSNPVILHGHDGFEKPYPFQADIVVGFDGVAQKKWDCVHAMDSQFSDAGSWQAATNPAVPDDPEEREQYLVDTVKKGDAAEADQYRDRLTELYGSDRAGEIQYAESFELCQYGAHASEEELKSLLPTGPQE